MSVEVPLPRSSLVVATRNRQQLLQETIESVLGGTHVPEEIVIVDQSQTVQELELVVPEQTTVRHLPLRTVGIASAHNHGFRSASNDVVVITDDDVLVAPDWLETLLTVLRSEGRKVVVTGPVIAAPPETAGAKAVSVYADERPARYRGRVYRDPLLGANMALYKEAFDTAGLMDERLGAGGRYRSANDNDLGFRLLEAGYEIVYEPRARVLHRAWRSGRQLTRLNWNYGRGQGAFYAKHFRLRDPYMGRRLRRTVVGRSKRIVVRPIRRRSIGGSGDLIYIAGVLTGALQWSVLERRSPGPS